MKMTNIYVRSTSSTVSLPEVDIIIIINYLIMDTRARVSKLQLAERFKKISLTLILTLNLIE